MKDINNMSLEQKVLELQQSVSKAKDGAMNPGSTNYEYLLNSKLGDQRDDKLAYFETLIAQAKSIMGGRLSALDPDVRNQAINEINNKLDDALLAFPGYEKEIAQGLGR